MAARSFLGAGDIFIDRLVNGVSQGLMGPYKAETLEIQPSVETRESTSKGRYDYGQTLDAVNLAQPTEITLALKEVVGDVLAMAFLGTAGAFNQVSGSLTAKEVTIAKIGSWYDLDAKNLEALISVTDSAATPNTLTEGLDYELNRPMGWIRAIEGGAIEAGDVVKASGGFNAATGTLVRGATLTEVRARVIFDGINMADGTQCTVTIHEAVMAANSAFDFLADDFGNVELTGRLKTPLGKTEPFTVLTQNPVQE